MVKKAARRSAPPKPEDQLEPEDFEANQEEFQGFESTASEESDHQEPEYESSESEEEEKPSVIAKDSKQKGDVKKIAETATADVKDAGERGVVYVGRIPHGFYEPQMRDYFGQFGKITRLRLSRNRRSGASKHFGFIEFSNAGVADVVSETMDNYLLFNHILKVKRIPNSQVHEKLWVGANRRYQAIPWGKVGKQRYERKHPREWWEELVEKDASRRKDRSKKLKQMGLEY